jgi:hypothetical protein
MAVYKVKGKVWLYTSGASAWHFISVPKNISAEIKLRFAGQSKGFGSIPVHANVGETSWRTSIFPDSKKGLYILPLKASVREQEEFGDGDTITFTLEI